MKKSLLLFSAALLGAASAFAEVGDMIYDGSFVYTVTSDTDAEVALTQYNGAASSVTVPSTIKDNRTYTVTKIGNSVFYNKTTLSSVTIPNTVRELGASVFYMCTSLKSLTLPESVTAMGGSCFYGSGITSFVVPAGVTAIEGKTFSLCQNLEEVVLPEGITTFGAEVFAQCTSLKSITLPSSLTTIGTGAFTNCSALETVDFGNPETLTIDDGAFGECKSLKSVFLPAGVDKIVSAPFIDCGALEEITVDPENPYFTSVDGVLYNKEMTILVNVPGALGGKFWIPESVIMIGPKAFYRNTNVTGVYMTENIQYLNYGIFYGCYALADLLVSPSLTSIATAAFSQCKALVDLTIPAGVKSLDFGSLFNNTNLRTLIMLPEEAPEVGPNALSGLKKAQLTVYVPVGCIDKYKDAPEWKTISNWAEITGTISMNLEQTDITLEGDDATDQLTINVDTDADYLRLLGARFTTSDPEVAIVDENGLVTAVDNGECTITVEMYDNLGGKAEGECKVSVSEVTGVGTAVADFSAESEIYNLQGIRIRTSEENLPAGIYIVRSGSEVKKVMVK